MKNLFTLSLVLCTGLIFAQQPFSAKTQPRMFDVLPGSARSDFGHKNSSSVSRSSDSCNTQDVLDYSTYNELIAGGLGISYVGSWNVSPLKITGTEINSSFITIKNYQNQVFSYALQAFDSLAFANYSAGTTYSKRLAASTITIDTLAMYMGIAADDTTPAGGLKGDSLVINIYPINAGIVSTTAIDTITFSGYNALQPFAVGKIPGYMRFVQFPAGVALTPGQGFAIGFRFYASDTTSHCFLSFSYADSCQQVKYMGQTFTSPAYPSPFNAECGYLTNGGSSFWGEIDSVSADSATTSDISNEYGYFGAGFPVNCSYEYTQNWEILAQVTVTSVLGVTITGSNPLTLTCPTTSHTINVSTTGDNAGLTYTWSANVSGSQTSGRTTIFNPGTYDVTVTNSQMCTATDELVASYANGLNITPSFSEPDSVCRGQAASFVNTSGAAGYSATWIFGQGPDSLQSTTNSTYTYTAGGSYNVTLTLDSGNCKFQTTQAVPVSSFCVGIENVAFDNNISIIPNPSNGNINITINGVDNNLDISIYNIIGQAVKSFATSDVTTVFNKNMDLSNLSNGTYLVKIQSGSKIATKKLVIAK